MLKSICSYLCLIIGLIALTGCESHVKVYHTKDGSKAYKGADGYWYWSFIDSSSTSNTTSYTKYTRQPYNPTTPNMSFRGGVTRVQEEEEQEFQAEEGENVSEAPADSDSSSDGGSGDGGSDGGGGGDD